MFFQTLERSKDNDEEFSTLKSPNHSVFKGIYTFKICFEIASSFEIKFEQTFFTLS